MPLKCKWRIIILYYTEFTALFNLISLLEKNLDAVVHELLVQLLIEFSQCFYVSSLPVAMKYLKILQFRSVEIFFQFSFEIFT